VPPATAWGKALVDKGACDTMEGNKTFDDMMLSDFDEPDLTDFRISEFQRERDVIAYCGQILDDLGGDNGPVLVTLPEILVRIRKRIVKMRDYQHIERYLNTLVADIYPQPPDPGHQAMLENVCKKWLPALTNLNSILDIGCAQGQAFPVLQRYANRVEGITLGADIDICRAKGLKAKLADMSFLPYPDGDFDLIFARHVLEHSPAPLLSLMEWRRVSKQWLMLILPNPDHYGYSGKNHYYVLNQKQTENIVDMAGWSPIWRDDSEATEIRLFCEKVKR
jgi:hypothetical protein